MPSICRLIEPWKHAANFSKFLYDKLMMRIWNVMKGESLSINMPLEETLPIQFEHLT
jgi:hypothetical protein